MKICRSCKVPNVTIGLIHDDAFLALKMYYYLRNKQPKTFYIDLPNQEQEEKQLC